MKHASRAIGSPRVYVIRHAFTHTHGRSVDLRILFDDYALLNFLHVIIASWIKVDDGFLSMLNRQTVSRAQVYITPMSSDFVIIFLYFLITFIKVDRVEYNITRESPFLS